MNKKIITISLISILSVSVLIIGTYIFYFQNKDISLSTSDWGSFGSYLSGTIGVIISLFTLIIVYNGYRYFLSKKQVEKQLDVVVDLIKQIQQEDYNYFKINRKNSKTGITKSITATIFDIIEIEEFKKNDKIYFIGKGVEDNINITNWGFFYKFYSNPLLPTKIANALKKFNNWDWKRSNYGDIENTDFIIIGDIFSFNASTPCLYFPNSEINSGEKMRKAVFELRNEIINWLKEHGIKDLNITISHINDIN